MKKQDAPQVAVVMAEERRGKRYDGNKHEPDDIEPQIALIRLFYEVDVAVARDPVYAEEKETLSEGPELGPKSDEVPIKIDCG